jgi:diguanylate cyclase
MPRATGVSAFTVTDAAARSSLVGQSPTSLASRSRDLHLFQQLSANPDVGLVADTPFRTQRTGRLVLPLGRALRGPDGRFAGMVIATLEHEQLRDFYRSVDVGRTAAITVLHPAGIVVFREPSSVSAMGERRRPIRSWRRSGRSPTAA